MKMLTNCKFFTAKTAGFCFGVDRAVKIVYNNLDNRNKVVTLGPIIHNRNVVEDLERKGVFAIDDVSQATADMTVVIRSHGVGKNVYDKLAEIGSQVIDATCPFVSRIHKNNSTPHEIIGDFTGDKFGKTDAKSITHSIYLTDSDLTQNVAFVGAVSVLPGYEEMVDLKAIATKDSDGDYVLTPELINNICTAKGIGDVHNVIFYANDGLSFKVASSENYSKVFSILFADGATDGSIKFASNLKMENQVGGCAVYVAPTIQVYDSESSAYVPYVAGTELFSVLKIKKNTTTEPDVNTWITAYTAYQA